MATAPNESAALGRALIAASGVFVIIAVLCFATRLVRSFHGTHDAMTDLVLAYGCSVAATAAALLLVTTSVMTWRAQRK